MYRNTPPLQSMFVIAVKTTALRTLKPTNVRIIIPTGLKRPHQKNPHQMILKKMSNV
jgi:hypothetical protein